MGRSAGPEPCGRAPTVSWNGGCRRIRGTSPRSNTRDGAGPEPSRPSLRIRPASRRFRSNGALPGRSGAALIRTPSRVRPATPRDIKALVRLCRAAAGSGDYVLAYLREMLAAREILVAEERGRIVAMMGVTPCLDRALWLGQARTHPDFRRQGYAQRLVEAARARVRRERRPALRLWTSERNLAAQRLAESAGFRRIAVFTRRVARTRRAPAGRRTSRPPAPAPTR